jgi:hypothetical protein
MATVYTLVATKCPTLPARTTPVKPATATATAGPATVPAMVSGTTSICQPHNQDAMSLEALGSAGAGAYAISYGLVLTDSGTSLTVAVATGQAMIDGPVNVDTAGTIALADNAYNWCYLLQNGTLTKTSSATDTPPAAPSSTCVFLGRITVAAGVITQIDGSGVLYFRGGSLYRQTGDATVPLDTPPNLIILTQTAGGRYLWDGGAYVALRNQDGRLAKTISDANTTLSASEGAKAILEISGTLTAGRNIVVPAIDGYAWDVFNNTAQTLTFKTASGTGIAVAAGKRARIYGNGTDIVRTTADV